MERSVLDSRVAELGRLPLAELAVAAGLLVSELVGDIPADAETAVSDELAAVWKCVDDLTLFVRRASPA